MRVQITTASRTQVYTRYAYVIVWRKGRRETVNVGALARGGWKGAELVRVRPPSRERIRDVRIVGREEETGA